jgi:hypothetical protein
MACGRGFNSRQLHQTFVPSLIRPEVPGFYAFSYTVADASAAPSFVVAGSGEAPEGKGNYKDHIVNLGDISSEGLLNKARFVLGEMENRMRVLGFGWGRRYRFSTLHRAQHIPSDGRRNWKTWRHACWFDVAFKPPSRGRS